MKSVLSAAALLVALAAPAFAEDTPATAPSQETATKIIVPTVAEPQMSVSPADVRDGKMPLSNAGKHGCGSKETVYLTN